MASIPLFLVVLAFDFIAFVLALAAEHMRSTARVVVDSGFNYSYCVYTSDMATKLGMIAFLFLLVSQVLTVGAHQCFCFGKGLNSGGSRTCSAVLSIICWSTFFLAEACLLWGSIKNAQHTRFRTILGSDDQECQTLENGVFEGGAALILISSLVSNMRYVWGSNSEEGFETESSSELGTYSSI